MVCRKFRPMTLLNLAKKPQDAMRDWSWRDWLHCEILCHEAEALAIFKQLVAEFPNRPEFRQELAEREGQKPQPVTGARGPQEGGRGAGDDGKGD